MEIVVMPKQGLIMTEGTLGTWHKKEGERVEEGELLFTMETDKLTNDIVSSVSGTLVRILVQEGETVPVYTPLAEIEP
jgi:pyruvate dehydrogenase E2 component (dihydrolipoamide acetyltransferase)